MGIYILPFQKLKRQKLCNFSMSHVEEPEELLCPITYALFRDPVTCLADGRTYERNGLVGFWKRRPLADFFCGPRLPSAQLVPNVQMRARVREWLDANPGVVPSGWATGDPGKPSTQADCDAISAAINRASAARAAAEAAETGGARALEAALNALQDFAPSVRLVGRTPGNKRNEFLGIYDRMEDAPLVAGRYAYQQRGSEAQGREARMIWYAQNGFWHAGWRANLGQQTGWLIVADAAVSPDHIVGEWQLWDGGKLWNAPRVRVEAVLPGEGGPHADGEDGGAANGDGDAMSDDGMDSEEEDEAMILGDGDARGDAAAEEVLARGAAIVHVFFDRPERWLGTIRDWMGTYDRECLLDGLPSLVNDRYAYALRRSPDKMLWWSAGYWHLGMRRHVGAQTALLIACDMAMLPELVTAPWMSFELGAWTPMQSRVRCAAGPAPESGLLSEVEKRLCWHGCVTSALAVAVSFALDLDVEQSFRVTLVSLGAFATVVLVKQMVWPAARWRARRTAGRAQVQLPQAALEL